MKRNLLTLESARCIKCPKWSSLSTTILSDRFESGFIWMVSFFCIHLQIENSQKTFNYYSLYETFTILVLTYFKVIVSFHAKRQLGLVAVGLLERLNALWFDLQELFGQAEFLRVPPIQVGLEERELVELTARSHAVRVRVVECFLVAWHWCWRVLKQTNKQKLRFLSNLINKINKLSYMTRDYQLLAGWPWTFLSCRVDRRVRFERATRRDRTVVAEWTPSRARARSTLRLCWVASAWPIRSNRARVERE